MDNLTGMLLANIKRIYSLHANFRSLEELMRVAIIIVISILETRNLMFKEAKILFSGLQKDVHQSIDWITWQTDNPQICETSNNKSLIPSHEKCGVEGRSGILL